MSVAVMLQAWGWVSVVWLVTVLLLIGRGRLPAHGRAYQLAGSVAAASVIAASAAEKIWPVAVLGLLWLRVEVFGHRHRAEPARAHDGHLERGARPDAHPEGHPDARSSRRVPAAPMPDFLVGALDRGSRPGASGHHSSPEPHPSAPHSSHSLSAPHPHLPHPHLGRRAVDRVFKVEMGIVIVIAVVLFGIWAEQNRANFSSNTDYVVCNWIDGC
jgi:hypothetical protein